jgi:signal transduction histidine kinase
MPLLRSSRRILLREKITPADVFDVHSERVIAEGRIILCALSLLTIWLDPGQLAHSATATQVIIAYSALALALLAIPFWKFPGSVAGYLVHAADIGFLAALAILSQARPGPVFALFILVILLAAALRWDWQGVLGTGAALAVIILAVGAVASRSAPARTSDGFALNGATVRGVDLIAAGGFLAYFSALRVRRRDQLSKLADWPGPDPSHMSSPSLATVLSHCARTLEVPRVLVVWEEVDEPFVNVAVWKDNVYEHTREIAGGLDDFLRSKHYSDSIFVTTSVRSGFVDMQGGAARLKTPIINEELIRRFQIRSVGTAPFVGTLCRGRVFILDRGSWGDFLLLLIKFVASRIGMELDRQILQRQTEEAAAARERIRLTRDLHDGILQSLTAARFQLKLLTDGQRDEDAQSRLDTIKQLLNNEQIRIRDFVRQTLPKSDPGTELVLSRDLRRVVSELGELWECTTSFSVDPQDASVPAKFGAHLSLMLTEAVSNAVRHGGASTVRVDIRKTNEHLAIQIQDDGHGITGTACKDDHKEHADLAALGPVSLRGRVVELGGSLDVRSSPLGTELQIRMPLA